jgi:cytochrome d ubiquinol oxidase subunit II
MIYLFDYATLKLIWWACRDLLVAAIMDGMDLGIGTLLPFVGRTDDERRVMLNSVGPHWEGNQVWFITAGGATFAAWPLVYAAAFSGFYIALILTLFALFFRPVGFDYRSKVQDPRWRNAWDWGIFVGGTVPALVFGVAFGNLLQGVPFQFDADLRVSYSGTFFELLNPFGLLAGLISVAVLVMHGAIYLQLRTEGTVRRRAMVAARVAGAIFIVLFAAAGFWVAFGFPGYAITSMPSPNTAFRRSPDCRAGPGAGSRCAFLSPGRPSRSWLSGAGVRTRRFVRRNPVLAFVIVPRGRRRRALAGFALFRS